MTLYLNTAVFKQFEKITTQTPISKIEESLRDPVFALHCIPGITTVSSNYFDDDITYVHIEVVVQDGKSQVWESILRELLNSPLDFSVEILTGITEAKSPYFSFMICWHPETENEHAVQVDGFLEIIRKTREQVPKVV